MFLKSLNDTQQKLFLGLAQQLIEADARISDQEREMIYALSAEMGQQELIPDPTDDVLRTWFPDHGSRTAIMLELIGLSACDGRVAPEESRLIRRLQKLFAIPDAEMKAYQAWVKKFLTVKNEAAAFFVSSPARRTAQPTPTKATAAARQKTAKTAKTAKTTKTAKSGKTTKTATRARTPKTAPSRQAAARKVASPQKPSSRKAASRTK
ncbi:MAG: hypothetical protein OZSIB_1031 [Candidatus Ozemobacter sibiricus]|jgi:uncharacterized tellurite resistance protein B-like protein|uniref:Co-chaperone DjlA N-terminal domain-containing protein n=1 Tax=Candidatus Ozemobacter sibiricus TaxID=2268124 RepID=A0A367ZNG2_9BACT|nr:MAG: hypothetical protein OZSIB_1031 [Candidatus Ozemobacter sibiricus]